MKTNCCDKQINEIVTKYVPIKSADDVLVQKDVFKFALQYYQTRFKFRGFNIKVNKEKKLSALQLLFTHGVSTKILKAKNESIDNLKTVLLKENQRIAA